MEPMMFTDPYVLTVEIFNTSPIKIAIKILWARAKARLNSSERWIYYSDCILNISKNWILKMRDIKARFVSFSVAYSLDLT